MFTAVQQRKQRQQRIKQNKKNHSFLLPHSITTPRETQSRASQCSTSRNIVLQNQRTASLLATNFLLQIFSHSRKLTFTGYQLIKIELETVKYS